MIEIIAQAGGAPENITSGGGQTIMWIVAGVVMALTGGGAGAVIQKKRTNGNGNGGFNKALCDERHKNIDKRQDELKDGQAAIHKKLDRLIEHQMGQ